MIYTYLVKFKKEFDSNKIKNAYLVLCELFSYLCEQERCIDSAIYNKLVEFKKIFQNNMREKTKLFITKDYTILNKHIVEKNMNETAKSIMLKTVEIKD